MDVLKGLGRYLSDWKNLLAHALVGVALVVVPLALPLPPIGRVAAFVAIVLLNVLRMKLDKKRKEAKAAATATTSATAAAAGKQPEGD